MGARSYPTIPRFRSQDGGTFPSGQAKTVNGSKIAIPYGRSGPEVVVNSKVAWLRKEALLDDKETYESVFVIFFLEKGRGIVRSQTEAVEADRGPLDKTRRTPVSEEGPRVLDRGGRSFGRSLRNHGSCAPVGHHRVPS